MALWSILLNALYSTAVIMLLVNTPIAADISDLCKAAKDDPTHTEQVAAWNDPRKKEKKVAYAVKLRCSDDGSSIKTCHPELLENDEGIEALSAAVLQDPSLTDGKGLVMTCLSDELPIFTVKDLGFAKGVCRKRNGQRKAYVKPVQKTLLSSSIQVDFECESNVITKCTPLNSWYYAGSSAWIKPRDTENGYMVACHKFSEPTIVKLKSKPSSDVRYTDPDRLIKPRDLLA